MEDNGRKSDLTERLWNLFGSMRFVIFLLILWAIASLLAVYLTETFHTGRLSDAQLLSNLGAGKYRLYSILGFLNPYQSFWYRLILGLLTFSLTVCILNHFGKTVRWIRDIKPPSAGEKLTDPRTVEIEGAPEVILSKVRSAFRFPLYRAVFVKSEDGGFRGCVRKGESYRLGSILVHLGLISLVLGGLAGSLFGFSITMWGKNGSEIKPPKADFTVLVKHFEIVRDKKGRVKDYLSTLAVLKDGKETVTKQIEVNHPLRYGGYSFYQSSWKQDWSDDFGPFRFKISIAGDSPFDTTLTLPYRRRVPIRDGDYWVEVKEYYPDFYIGSNRRPGTHSLEPRNPAARLAVYSKESGGTPENYFWSFLRFPRAHFNKQSQFRFLFLGDLRSPVLYTGIQVTKRPGSWLVWAGLILGTIGLLLAFFIPYRRYLIVLKPAGKDANNRLWELSMSIKSSRNSGDLDLELSKIVSNLFKRLVTY